MSQKTNERYEYLSLIRVISCIGIVVLHTYYVYVSYFDATATQKVVSYTIRNLMMWAVPCFVMVTGALLLDPSRAVPVRKLFSKYILRAVLAILVFTLVFHVLDAALTHQKLMVRDLLAFLVKVYTDGSWTHMWYLYMLVGLYLLMPAYKKVAEGVSKAEMRYLLVIGLVFMILLPNLDAFTKVKTGFYVAVYTVYPFYLFLGYALHRGIVRIPRWLGAVMLLVGMGVMAWLTSVQLYTGNEVLKKLLTNYSFLVNALMATGMFSLLRPKKKGAVPVDEAQETAGLEKKHVGHAVLAFLDKNSFGIYLLHFMVLKLAVMVLGWNPYPVGGNLMLALVSCLVFGISLLVTFLLRLIPGVKRIL